MRKTTLLRLLTLTATGALAAACGAPDRTFAADNSPQDAASGQDSATGSDAGGDGTSTPDQGGAGDTGTTQEGGRMDAQSDQRADAGSDARIDGTFDTSSDTWSPDTTLAPDTYGSDNNGQPDVWSVDTSLADANLDVVTTIDAGGEFDCSTVPAPTVSPSGTVNLCPGRTLALTSSAAASYAWSTGGTTQAIDVTAAGAYTVTTTESHGCTGTSAATNVVMYPTPPTPTITAGGPTRFCKGGVLTLTANSAASYVWSSGATTQAIQVNDGGSYFVTTTDINGCPATSAPTVVEVVEPQGEAVFSYTGNVVNWVVPECVTAIAVDAYGAQGGSSNSSAGLGMGGLGAQVHARLATTPGSTLQFRVGGAGSLCSVSNAGGWNGGGVANCAGTGTTYSGTGGGATDVRIAPYSLYERVIVAGGGGGSGYNCNTVQDSGGVGGGLTGGRFPTTCPANASGSGGTQSGGGAGGSYLPSFGTAGSGIWGAGGSGVCTGGPSTASQGGGGGGGYYGGGGGCWVGGGGGSDYLRNSLAVPYTMTTGPGKRAGHGRLDLKWPAPPAM
jgi:hypothetical protein